MPVVLPFLIDNRRATILQQDSVRWYTTRICSDCMHQYYSGSSQASIVLRFVTYRALGGQSKTTCAQTSTTDVKFIARVVGWGMDRHTTAMCRSYVAVIDAHGGHTSYWVRLWLCFSIIVFDDVDVNIFWQRCLRASWRVVLRVLLCYICDFNWHRSVRNKIILCQWHV